MDFSKLAQELLPELSLCADENPWDYNPLELTLVYEMFGSGRSIVAVAKLYFKSGATDDNRNWLINMRQKASWKIYSHQPNILAHHHRTKVLWETIQANKRLVGPRPIPNVVLWQKLMVEEPLVVSEKWLADHSTQLPAEEPTPTVWADDFDLSKLDGLSELPEVPEVLDWDGQFFRKDIWDKRWYQTDDLLVAEIIRVEERISRDTREKQIRLERKVEQSHRREAHLLARSLRRQREQERGEQVKANKTLLARSGSTRPTTSLPKPAWGEREKASTAPSQTTKTNGTEPEKTPAKQTSAVGSSSGLPRRCPRCHGSMIVERDWYGVYATCLSCGYTHEPTPAEPYEQLDETETGEKKRRRQPSHGKQQL